jgi:uncharacterized protein YbjT (DUF2867 family)
MAAKTALILGATGLIGQALTQQLLENPYYDTVKVLVRTPLELEHPKLIQERYDYDHPQADLLTANHVYCCLGTTIKKAGSPEAFRKVDYDYVVQTAALAQEQGARRMAVVSSMGADANSKVLYSRVKGEMEAALQAQGWETLYIVRPSLLLGERDEFRLGESIGKVAAKGLSFLIPDKYKGIEGSQVAKAMQQYVTQGEAGQHIVESDALRTV